jgi:alpha/beta superfamily hydrolase
MTSRLIDGPAGALQCSFNLPQDVPATALALICHPHPQFGGSMDNKVVQTLARAFGEMGFATMRFNFRGVGESAGEFDDGMGETEDAAAALAWARTQVAAGLPLIAAGFSFGCYVQSRLLPRSNPEQLVLVGPAVSRFQIADVPRETVVIHGEEDDVVPLAEVMNWARPQGLPVTVFPGTGHFFHGRLTELKSIVKRFCRR